MVELRILDRAPVMGGRIHREARRQRTVGANDQRVLPRATFPRRHFAAHKLFHVLHVLALVRHLVAFVVALGVQIIKQLVNLWPIVRRQVGDVLIQMFEVILLHHRRFVDVIIGCDAVVVGDFRKLAHVVHVVAADVDIEHHSVAIVMLSLDQILKIRTNRIQSLGQRLSLFHRIHGEIDRRDARIAQTIDYFRLHQATIRRQVYEDVFLGAVVDDLVNKFWTQQRFATHQSEHARAHRMQPIDRTPGRVFSHAFHFVVVRPAIVTIQVALPFGEQIRNDRPQVFVIPTRFEIRRAPGLPGANRIQLLIFRLRHRLRIGMNRIGRFR